MSFPRVLSKLALAAALTGAFAAHANDPIPAAVQTRVDGYKAKLQQWAATPSVVKAAKASTASNGMAGMTPAKWTELDAKSPEVTTVLTNEPGKFVGKIEADDKLINKIVIRDKHGNAVAASTKPLLYNVAARPVFKTAITGTPWQQDHVAKDVTTQVRSVQIATPIKEGGEIIGVIHASVNAD
jgi:hypothetical protein